MSTGDAVKKKKNSRIQLGIIPGHFATNHSHVNYYVDMTSIKTGLKMARETAKELAARLGTVILASGETDIITDGIKTVLVHNGTKQLGTVTGTGCMQGALCAAYLSAASGFDAAVSACAVFGICGQLAQTEKGSGSFMVNLLDALSTVTDEQISALSKIQTL